MSLGTLYSNHGGIGHLDEAPAKLEHAEKTLPAGDLDLSSVYMSMCGARLQRFAARGQRAELHAAVAAARRSVPATPAGHRSLSSRHANLAGELRELYNVTGDLRDLGESISQGRAGVADLHADSPGRSMVFGHGLRARKP